MGKRRTDPFFFPVDLAMFGDQRFGVVAGERKELVQTVWGRFLAVAAHAYKTRAASLTRDAIQLAAGLPKREPWFADELVAADLASRSDDGLYRLAGVRDRLQVMEDAYAKAVEDGRRGAEKRWGSNRGAIQNDGGPKGPPPKSIGFDSRDRDLGREEEGAAASRPPSASSSEKQSSRSSDSSPKNPADTAALDPAIPCRSETLRSWLELLGFTKRSWDSWLENKAGGDADLLETWLLDAKCVADDDPEQLAPKKLSQSDKARAVEFLTRRLDVDRKNHKQQSTAPPGGASGSKRLVLFVDERAARRADQARRIREGTL